MMKRDIAFGAILALAAVVFAISQCKGGSSYEYVSDPIFETQKEMDLAVDAAADLASSTYEAEGAPYGCTEDCSGHEAGWQWAAANEVFDSGSCFGNSQSFQEGCIAFVEVVKARVEEQNSR